MRFLKLSMLVLTLGVLITSCGSETTSESTTSESVTATSTPGAEATAPDKAPDTMTAPPAKPQGADATTTIE